ncbi:MAG: thiopeptide-type bacteriocin biosynthesis protein, partial [Polyangiales bacterium]
HGDAGVRAQVEAHHRAEEERTPDAIFAEVVHLPEGRVGNVLLRPTLRGYEIPYLGRSGAPAERQIDPSDLVLCLIDDQLRLRSKRLDKEVIPRLTSAHNYASTRNLPVYKFLCTLARRRRAEGAIFPWGPFAEAAFLPRVTHGRLVLARARWRLSRAWLDALKATRGDTRFVAVQSLRAELGLPRYVALAEGDRELPLDLDNVLGAEALVDSIKEDRSATLLELFPGPDLLCCSGPEGSFVHELVVPMLRSVAAPRPVERALPRHRKAPIAVFAPGAEWLYAKLYTGTATADQVLAEVVAPVAHRARAQGRCDRWFFLRYGDPHWHLRLRMHGASTRLWSEALSDLFETVRPLVADGRVSSFSLATYQRETDRYGGPEGIVLAEQIFEADSDAVAATTLALDGDDGARVRWRLALRGVDAMLDDLGLGLEEKRLIVERSKASFGARFRPDVALTRSIGDRFRQERASLEALFDQGRVADGALDVGLRALGRRSEAMRPLVGALRAKERRGELSRPIVDMAGSFIHMHVNRLLRAEAVAQEIVIYDFLGRMYDSWKARGALRRGAA